MWCNEMGEVIQVFGLVYDVVVLCCGSFGGGIGYVCIDGEMCFVVSFFCEVYCYYGVWW